MNRRSKLSAFALTCILIVATACDPLITTFKAAFATSKPFISSLVRSGAITQGKADVVVRDIDEGIDAAVKGEQCLKAVNETGSAKKVAKAKCYFTAAQDLRVILARHSMSGNAKLEQIAMVVEGAIAAFEAYYSSVSQPTPSGHMGGPIKAASDDAAEKELERKMKELKQRMKEITGE